MKYSLFLFVLLCKNLLILASDTASENTILDTIVKNTPIYNEYKFSSGEVLSSTPVRPANIFFEALLGRNATTMPGENTLFAFKPKGEEKTTKDIHQRIRHTIEKKARNNEIVTIQSPKYLQHLYGSLSYQLSCTEILTMLNSQRILISPLLPRLFYIDLKKNMEKDGILLLPGNEYEMETMQTVGNSNTNTGRFLQKTALKPQEYGFGMNDTLSFEQIMKLTLYQVGAMVVKREEYRSFIGEGMKIKERRVDPTSGIAPNDTIQIVSMSGIRGFHTSVNQLANQDPKNPHGIDRIIMKETFKTALQASESGYIVLPAIGMGVWKGDPDVYWRAFLDAVLETDLSQIKAICINPGHRKTSSGKYQGHNGDEFETIMQEYRSKNPKNKNLKKIKNLYTQQTDLFLLAQNIQQQTDETVSLFNASDPDVTLGFHVCEYVNEMPHVGTTEENYGAAGTSGLGFEGISRIFEHPERIESFRNCKIFEK